MAARKRKGGRVTAKGTTSGARKKQPTADEANRGPERQRSARYKQVGQKPQWRSRPQTNHRGQR